MKSQVKKWEKIFINHMSDREFVSRIEKVLLKLNTMSQIIKTYVYRNTYIHWNIIPIFVIAKYWKPPKCLSVPEWLNRLCYIHTTEYY